MRRVRPFGPFFADLIRAKYRNPTRFADAVGLSQSYISKIINGEKPPLDRLDQWIRALDLDESTADALALAAELMYAPPRVAKRIEDLEAATIRQDGEIKSLTRDVENFRSILQGRSNAAGQPPKP